MVHSGFCLCAFPVSLHLVKGSLRSQAFIIPSFVFSMCFYFIQMNKCILFWIINKINKSTSSNEFYIIARIVMFCKQEMKVKIALCSFQRDNNCFSRYNNAVCFVIINVVLMSYKMLKIFVRCVSFWKSWVVLLI